MSPKLDDNIRKSMLALIAPVAIGLLGWFLAPLVESVPQIAQEQIKLNGRQERILKELEALPPLQQLVAQHEAQLRVQEERMSANMRQVGGIVEARNERILGVERQVESLAGRVSVLESKHQ